MEGTRHRPPIDASKLVGPPITPPSGAPPSGAGGTDAASTDAASPDGPEGAVSPDPFAERPELYVGAAFAGGIVLAGLLKVLSR